MKPYYFLIIVIFFIWSCEKDDICSDPNARTPHLIIRFYDITNQTDTKMVDDLLIVGVGNSLPYGAQSTRDSIAIPLKILENNSSFQLIKDYSIDDNNTPDDPSDDFDTGNSDEIVITYSNNQIYMSSACGYKNVYDNTAIGFTNDSNNWILNTSVINTTIENENNAHIHIFH